MPATILSTSPALVQDTFTEWFQRQLLKNIEHALVFKQFGQRDDIPKRRGNVSSWIGIEELDLPASPLTEGNPPSPDAISTRKVQATSRQWGAYSDISDIGDYTPFHDVFTNLIERQGRQAARLYDRECQKTLQAATNLVFADSVASRSLLTAANTLDSADIKRVIASMRNSGVPPITRGRDGKVTTGKYIIIIDGSVQMDLMTDATFVQASSFQTKDLFNGVIAENWMGATFVVSNFMPTVRGYATPTLSAPAGTLTPGTYFVVIEYVNPFSKFVEGVSIVGSQVVAAAEGLGIALPDATVPGTTRKYLFNIYVGTSAATVSQQTNQTNLAGNQTITLNTVGVGGAAPTAQAPLGVEVHTSYVIGQGAYGVTELMGLEMKQTSFAPDKSDVLGQRRTAGWKGHFIPVILNNAYMRRVESVSAF